MSLVDLRKTLPKHRWKKYRKRRHRIIGAVLHCTGSTNQSPRRTANYHITRKNWPGIAYHEFVASTGDVYLCNDQSLRTYHSSQANSRTVGIVMGYEGKKAPPPAPQLELACKRLANVCLKNKFSPLKRGWYGGVRGHREFPWMIRIFGRGVKRLRKTCPGMAIDMDFVRTRVIEIMQKEMKRDGCYPYAIDGMWGRISTRGLKCYQYYGKSPFTAV
ncbi:MAG: N-acetylmuramoyl-L-alanine amidase [Thiotrichaceae bacterium]